jgi:hypothetical protein
MTAAAALDILKTIQNCGCGVLKDKTLYFQDSPTSPPPDSPPPPDTPLDQPRVHVESVQAQEEVVTAVTDTENLLQDECGQCGQVWSECPQVETQTQTEVEADVVNCGQTQDVLEIEESNHLLLVEESVTPSELPQETVEVEPEAAVAVVENPPAQEVVQEIVVGSVVVWPKCPGHWESWAPFVVEHIDGEGFVKLEYVGNDYAIHISELRLAN